MAKKDEITITITAKTKTAQKILRAIIKIAEKENKGKNQFLASKGTEAK